MTLQISPELEERLRQAAQKRGLRPDMMAQQILEHNLPKSCQAGSLSSLFAEWNAEDASDDPTELAMRKREFAEFQQAMNRNRLESDGPDARIPFP